MKKLSDLTGTRFGKLTVIENAGRDSSNQEIWKCHCDCGNDCIVLATRLKSGRKKSCGCLQKENRENIKKNWKI